MDVPKVRPEGRRPGKAEAHNLAGRQDWTSCQGSPDGTWKDQALVPFLSAAMPVHVSFLRYLNVSFRTMLPLAGIMTVRLTPLSQMMLPFDVRLMYLYSNCVEAGSEMVSDHTE